MSYTEDRSAVKRLTKQIDQAEADTDAWKWERAERLARMCETKTQREVAGDVGLDHATVSIITRIWKSAGVGYPGNQRRSYTEVYNETKGTNSAQFGKNGGRTPKEKAATVIAALADPKALELVLADGATAMALESALIEAPTNPPTTTVRPDTDPNVSALGLIAEGVAKLERANTHADMHRLTERQTASAEVMLRGAEAEIAVWRDRVEGGVSDEAIAAASEGSF